MPIPLFTLLDQLTASSITGKRLRRAFHDDPETVTKDLEPAGRGALYTMDRGVISGQVSLEYTKELKPPESYNTEFPKWFNFFNKWPFPPNEFSKKELPPECAAEQSQEYPDPQPEAFGITPSSGPVSASLQVEIVGQGFVKGKTSFTIEDSSGNKLPVASMSFSGGTFRCGHLTGTVTLPAAPKQYAVRVFVDIGNGTLNEIPSDLTFDVTT